MTCCYPVAANVAMWRCILRKRPPPFLFQPSLGVKDWLMKIWTGFFLDVTFNPLNPELNPICYLLALLGAAGERQGRSPAEILGSNPTGGMDICLL